MQQPFDGPLRVAPVGGILDVTRGEQYLAGDDLMHAECALVTIHQDVLPNRRRRLLSRKVVGAVPEPQKGHAGSDRTARHEDHLAARTMHARERIHQMRDLCRVLAAHGR